MTEVIAKNGWFINKIFKTFSSESENISFDCSENINLCHNSVVGEFIRILTCEYVVTIDW